jgi:3-hydroxyisobutyrate dehydrogenase-like beta-hydroxyacid dehydrogenase
MTQTIQTVALLSPGDMGHSVGQTLVEHGMRVITCLEGRSERTRGLAAEAGIAGVPTYGDLVREADLLLSILVPAQAKVAAGVVAQAVMETGAELAYADCNAIAPQTVCQIANILTATGVTFVDASIVGGPPRGGSSPRLYASGPDTGAFEALAEYGLHVVVIGEEIGLASAIKMCYAALTKGSSALYIELLTAARALGVGEALAREFQGSQAAMLQRMQRLPGVSMKSRRWVGEMEEIARTFEGVGLTPRMLAGAADVYRLLGSTSLADRTPEDTDPLPSLEEMIAVLAEQLERE